MPQMHEPGAEAEVDWGEARVVLGGGQVKVHLFFMRACHSGAAFSQASQVRDPAGVPGGARRGVRVVRRRLRAGALRQLRSAVAKVLRGRRRVETDRFVALRSHYLFESSSPAGQARGARERVGFIVHLLGMVGWVVGGRGVGLVVWRVGDRRVRAARRAVRSCRWPCVMRAGRRGARP